MEPCETVVSYMAFGNDSFVYCYFPRLDVEWSSREVWELEGRGKEVGQSDQVCPEEDHKDLL